MSAYGFKTTSGGLVEINSSQSGIYGSRLWLHVDQTVNISNGEGEASILLTNSEVKELITILNKYIEHDERKPFVYVIKNE